MYVCVLTLKNFCLFLFMVVLFFSHSYMFFPCFYSSVEIFYEIQKLYTFEYDILRFSPFCLPGRSHSLALYQSPAFTREKLCMHICVRLISMHMNTNLCRKKTREKGTKAECERVKEREEEN